MIGLGMRIESESDFDRRAAVALNGCTLTGFAKRLHEKLKAGDALKADERRWIYKMVHERRSQITDDAVLEYAAARTKGAD